MRKVELYERIRRDQAERGWSIRRLAKEHRVHRREVRQALLKAQPPPAAPLNRSRPVLGPLMPVIDAILEQDRREPRKQRHTAHRIWERLVSEHGAEIAEATVRRYVGGRKRELWAPGEVMVPQVHLPGGGGGGPERVLGRVLVGPAEGGLLRDAGVRVGGGVPLAAAGDHAAGVPGGAREGVPALRGQLL